MHRRSRQVVVDGLQHRLHLPLRDAAGPDGLRSAHRLNLVTFFLSLWDSQIVPLFQVRLTDGAARIFLPFSCLGRDSNPLQYTRNLLQGLPTELQGGGILYMVAG